MEILSYKQFKNTNVKCIESNCNSDPERPKSSPASSQFSLEGVLDAFAPHSWDTIRGRMLDEVTK